MAAFSESDRANIRLYLGFGTLFLQADPRLENAITKVQAIADGGMRPDNSTQLLVLSIITDLQSYDASIKALNLQAGAREVDGQSGVKLNSVMELGRLRSGARGYVHRLACVLDIQPRADIYSCAPEVGLEQPGYRSLYRTGY